MLWIIRLGLWAVMVVLSLVLSVIGLPIVGFLAWRRAWVRGDNALGQPVWVWAWARIQAARSESRLIAAESPVGSRPGAP